MLSQPARGLIMVQGPCALGPRLELSESVFVPSNRQSVERHAEHPPSVTNKPRVRAWSDQLEPGRQPGRVCRQRFPNLFTHNDAAMQSRGALDKLSSLS